MLDQAALTRPRQRLVCALFLAVLGAHALTFSVAEAAPTRLDVGVLEFDPGIPADVSTHRKLGVFPEIRKSEARYMPVLLREVLMATGEWGAVRVLPEVMASSELLVTGTILHSDGQRLELRVTARDASGASWLDAVYAEEVSPAAYPVQVPGDPFLGLYRRIADELLSASRQQGEEKRAAVRRIAELRYAQDLAPEAFSGYLALAEDDTYRLARLPAEGDPMLARVLRLRDQEYLFIDTVDEQYLALSEQMAPTYHLWRQFGAEQAVYREDFEDRVSARDRRGAPGSYAALQQTYDVYRLSRMHEQDLDELATGFNNEVAPTVMEVSGRVFRLSGSLESQYAEWREILRRIFALETGLSPAS